MGNSSSSSEEPNITALAEIVRHQYPEELTIIGLKSLLGIDRHTRNEIVYILSGRAPLQCHVAKAALRYARSITT